MRSPYVLLSAVLLSCIAATGCDDSAAKTAATTDTLTIEHSQGSSQVPLNPRKVVILNPTMLDIADALQVNVLGVPQTSSHLPPFLAKYRGKEYLNAGTLFEPDYEAISAAQPDVIIAGGRAHDAYQQLSAIAPTLALDIDPQHVTQSLTQRTQQLASLFGKQEQAKVLLDDFNNQIARIRQQSAGAGSAMVLMISGGKMSAYSAGSRFGFIFDALGFKPAAVFQQTGNHGNVVTSEFILNANPDWLFVLDRDNAIGRAEGQSALQVLDNPLIHKTRAWQQQHIVYLDSAALYIAGGLQSYRQLMDKVSATLSASAAPAAAGAAAEAR